MMSAGTTLQQYVENFIDVELGQELLKDELVKEIEQLREELKKLAARKKSPLADAQSIDSTISKTEQLIAKKSAEVDELNEALEL